MVGKTAKRRPGPVRSRLIVVAARARGAIARCGRDLSGVVSIEMAFIFPIMLILFVGLVDAANLLSASRRVSLTAGTLGDLVAQAPGEVTAAQLERYFSAAAPIMDPYPAEKITLEIYNYTKSSGSLVREWKYVRVGAGCGGELVLNNDDLELLMAEGNDVVVSRTCYTWQPVVGIILGFKETVVQNQFLLRPRQTARMICKDCT